jgi:hypothetical protein
MAWSLLLLQDNRNLPWLLPLSVLPVLQWRGGLMKKGTEI